MGENVDVEPTISNPVIDLKFSNLAANSFSRVRANQILQSRLGFFCTLYIQGIIQPSIKEPKF